MKKGLVFLCITLLFVFSSGMVGATTYVFWPTSDPDLGNLDHWKYYTWGIDWEIPDGEVITGASIKFDDMYNWNNEPNVLYLHLLDSADSGVAVGRDRDDAFNDFFAGQGILLNQWENLTTRKYDYYYRFDDYETSMLISYLSDGNFGLGFDPDCHYYNDYVKFKIYTEEAPVPEPATLFLIGTGLAGIAGIRRKMKK